MEEKQKQELIKRLDSFINDEYVHNEAVFDFDDDIKIAVEEYKTIYNHGYCITFQSIRIGDWYIKANHYNGEKLVETAERLRASIDTIGLEKTIETLTHEQDWTNKKIRELN